MVKAQVKWAGRVSGGSSLSWSVTLAAAMVATQTAPRRQGIPGYDRGPRFARQRGDRLLLLLVGGDKSTQSKDIERAILLARGFEE